MSTSATAAAPAVNAIQRIGEGPWANAAGEIIARNTWELHDDAVVSALNSIAYDPALTEKGERIDPKFHSILTGTLANGKAFQAGGTVTCANWTSSSDQDAVQVGHMDKKRRSRVAGAKILELRASGEFLQPGRLEQIRRTGPILLFRPGLKKKWASLVFREVVACKLQMLPEQARSSVGVPALNHGQELTVLFVKRLVGFIGWPQLRD